MASYYYRLLHLLTLNMAQNPNSDIRKQVLALLDEGWSLAEIVKKHGMNWINVSRLMRRADKSINYSPVKNFARYRSAVLASRVRTLRKLGFSFEDIGEEIGKAPKWARELHYKEPTGSPTVWIETTQHIKVSDGYLPSGVYRLNASAYSVVGHVTDSEGTLHYVRLSNLKGKVKFPEGHRNRTD